MPQAPQLHAISKLVNHASNIENIQAQVSGEAFHRIGKVQKKTFLTLEMRARLKDLGVILPDPTPAAPATPAEPDLPDSLSFTTGTISFSGGTPVGGWSNLNLYKNGKYEFSGHFHDSGAPSYDAGVGWVVVGIDGTAFSFVAKVHLNGTFEAGSRNGDWFQSGNNQQIADHWKDLTTSWHYRWQADVNWDYGIIIKQIEDGLKVAGTVIGAIVAVVALV
jgi:hypothetical protein